MPGSHFSILVGALVLCPCFGLAQTVTDYDGNVYPMVTIGDQVWLAANMRATHYADGALIPYNCFPDGDAALEDTLGRLYTWNAAARNATAEGAQGICPNGWHLPTDAEWITLIDEAGGDTVAAGHLKSTSLLWQSPNPTDNATGFSALPAGNCYSCSFCDFLGTHAEFWTSTPIDAMSAKNWSMYHLGIDVFRHYNQDKANGFSVRCISNSPAGIREPDRPLFHLQPNPTTGASLLQLTSFAGSDVTLWIHDVMGRSLAVVALHSSRTYTIDRLPSGVFMITVADDQHRWQERLVVQ